MKSWISHSIVAAVAIIATILLMNKCSSPTVVTDEVIVRDTVYTENTVTVTDTIRVVKWRTRYDTLLKVVEVPTDTSPNSSSEKLYTYAEFYKDSSLQVAGNIFYTGKINRHDQMLVTMKDDITFIPTIRTIYRNRDILTTKTITRQPRFLLGSYLTAQAFTLQQLGVTATIVDNRFREYAFGKDVLSSDGWMVSAKIPIIYGRK